ncbi:hypothetical protein K340107D12_03150 [Blautia parvula]|uniref:Uncharacterized protein n=1 Tax=Blautia parvula TaxID=2877527 RepID=A0ABQ0BLT8_9FIRM
MLQCRNIPGEIPFPAEWPRKRYGPLVAGISYSNMLMDDCHTIPEIRLQIVLVMVQGI